MNTPLLKKLTLPLVTLLVLLACALPALPSPDATNPTPDPLLIQTIVVATAGAAQTQTALVLPPSPSDTPTSILPPLSTPTETSTPTATVIFIIPTSTYTPTATSLATATETADLSTGSGCELVSQTPANGRAYSSRQKFSVEWRVKNTGSQTWLESNYDFFFSGGRDMHETDIFDLPRNVRPGGEITFNVEMRAPGRAGTYTSTWVLGSQREALCTVSIRITVK